MDAQIKEDWITDREAFFMVVSTVEACLFKANNSGNITPLLYSIRKNLENMGYFLGETRLRAIDMKRRAQELSDLIFREVYMDAAGCLPQFTKILGSLSKDFEDLLVRLDKEAGADEENLRERLGPRPPDSPRPPESPTRSLAPSPPDMTVLNNSRWTRSGRKPGGRRVSC